MKSTWLTPGRPCFRRRGRLPDLRRVWATGIFCECPASRGIWWAIVEGIPLERSGLPFTVCDPHRRMAGVSQERGLARREEERPCAG